MSAREQKLRRWVASLTPEQARDALIEMTEIAIDDEMVHLSNETGIPYWDATGEPVIAEQTEFTHAKAWKQEATVLRAELDTLKAQEPVAWRDPKNSDPGQGCTYDVEKHKKWPHIYTQALYAHPIPSEPNTPTVKAAEAMGSKGGPIVETERLAFEAWMRGHGWLLLAEWTGAEYRSTFEKDGRLDIYAMRTREMWAAWRDRAALTAVQHSNTQ